MQQPTDFDEFWNEVGRELSGVPVAPEVEPIPMRTTEFADMYGVRITSIGPYRLFGYLSIPRGPNGGRGEGPFPAIYYAPKNGSVLETIPQGTSVFIRERYVTFSIACRGMRNSDRPYAAMYPGQLTDGLESLESYVYRGIAADTIRGLDYLVTRPEVDGTKVAAWGNDIALLAAALNGGATHVVSTPSYLFDTLEMASTTSTYPLEEFNDYLRLHPDRTDKVASILNHFNLRWHAPAITAEALLMAEHESGIYSPDALADLAAGIAGEVTVFESERSSFKDGLFAEKWITEKLIGKDAKPIVPEHWQSYV
ncbi:MAG: acetylxylan esterase [Chloroflexi bacterium]|nr:acetylxylan esterase [Chloroflexota bacterium]